MPHRFIVLVVTALVVFSVNGHSAEINKLVLPGNAPDFITIDGEIADGDGERFVDVVGDSKKVSVILRSPGGRVKDALEIGAEIRLRNFATMVPSEAECYSACALIWVGGARRYMSPTSSIGFHAAYREVDGVPVESGMANAEIGSYLTHLGLRIEAIRYFTLAGSTEFLLLSPKSARALGIEIYEQNGDQVTTPWQKPTVDVFARRFVAYSALAARCTSYLGSRKDNLVAGAKQAAETGQPMVGSDQWIELWMREMEIAKHRFANESTLPVCLSLERTLRLQNLDTGFFGPAYDCGKAGTPTERAICRDKELWAPDRAISAIYNWLMANVEPGTKSGLKSAQREWLAYRNSCGGNTDCLSEVYAERIAQISQIELPD